MGHHVEDLGNTRTVTSLPLPTKLIFLLDKEISLVRHQSTLSKWLFSVVLLSYMCLDVVSNPQLNKVCTSLNISFLPILKVSVTFTFSFLSHQKPCLTVLVFQRC